MLTRGIFCLAALAAIVAALRDTTPADPVRSPVFAPVRPAGKSSAADPNSLEFDEPPGPLVTLVRSAVWLKLPIGKPALSHEPLVIDSALPDAGQQPRELQVLVVSAGQRAACLAIDQALNRARDRDLQDKATIAKGSFRYAPLHVFPVWDIQDAYGLPVRGEMRVHGYVRDGLLLFPGAAMQIGSGAAHETHDEFWQAYRRGLEIRPMKRQAGHDSESFPDPHSTYPVFCPFGVWSPWGDAPPVHVPLNTRDPFHTFPKLDDHDDVFLDLADDKLYDGVPIVPGGLMYVGNSVDHADLQHLLYDPAVVRMVRALRHQGLAVRNSARRAALCDDDDRLRDFVLEELCRRPAPEREVAAGAADILRSFPHRGHFGSNHAVRTCLRACAQSLPAPQLAREIQTLARTTLDPDQLGELLKYAAVHPALEVRRAAMECILARLPRQSLPYSTEPPSAFVLARVAHWPPEEWAWFFDALLARLRSELQHGDVERALSMLGEAMFVCDKEPRPTWQTAGSRLRELGVTMFENGASRSTLRNSAGAMGVAFVARELIRSSDPAVRRGSCATLLALDYFREDLEVLRGDPYTADLLEADAQRRSRNVQPGNGFF